MKHSKVNGFPKILWRVGILLGVIVLALGVGTAAHRFLFPSSAEPTDVSALLPGQGTLSQDGLRWCSSGTDGAKHCYRLSATTAVYVQSETLYRLDQSQVSTAVMLCAQTHCPVYSVPVAEASTDLRALVLALASEHVAQFPDPEPWGKTPIPWPAPGSIRK